MTIASASPVATRPPRRQVPYLGEGRLRGLGWLMGAELAAGVLGFGATVHLARRLGPGGFATVEWGAAVAAWLLVVVRGGIEAIVHREAARRPRLIRPLTDLLLGMKCALALAGYTVVLALAAVAGPDRGRVVAVAGLIVFPAALAADVAPRAGGRLGGLAAAQGLRALGYALAAWGLVSGTGQAMRAAGCAVLAEAVAALVLLRLHARRHGLPIPRYRRRAWKVLARRGAVASLARFGRVGLYAADVLALGWWSSAAMGPYAAARRIVFALAAVGLVVPAAVAPAIARARAEGRAEARRLVGSALAGLLAIALPAAVGLAMTSGRWMSLLFGPGYGAGGPGLALIAARLPWLLAASFAQAALVACRLEGDATRLVLGLSALALAVVPASAALGGAPGVGAAALTIEVVGTCGGWLRLRRLGLAPAWPPGIPAALLGCLALALACRLASPRPLGVVCAAGATAYAAVWWGCREARPC